MTTPQRTIVHGEALAWLDAHPAEATMSVVTSLPDVSELSPLDFDAWRAWFVAAAQRVLRWIPDDGVAIFFQSDIRFGGAWVDKGYLVQRAAEEERATLLWHTVVCRHPPGTVSQGRASYSHMLCFARSPAKGLLRTCPDVMPDAGAMPWSRAMGVHACRAACEFLLRATSTRVVVDPFCGQGTVLAVANALGLDAVGVELSAKRCRRARTLTVSTL